LLVGDTANYILTCQDGLPCRWQVRNKLATSPSMGKLRGDESNEFRALYVCCVGGRFDGRWSSVDSDPVYRLAWSRGASTRRVITGHTTYGQVNRGSWPVHPCSLQVLR